MAITDAVISQTLATYLERYPDEAEALSAPLRMLAGGSGFASRHSFPMHMTVGALLVRGGREILLIEHRAYGITLQPGGHLEPAGATLVDAAVRELAEETGLDPAGVSLADPVPTYVEYGRSRRAPRRASRITSTSTWGTRSRRAARTWGRSRKRR